MPEVIPFPKAPDEEILFTASGVVLMTIIVAFQEEEERPRRRALGLLNSALAIAAQRGYRDAGKLRTFFSVSKWDKEAGAKMLEDLYRYLPPEDFCRAMGLAW